MGQMKFYGGSERGRQVDCQCPGHTCTRGKVELSPLAKSRMRKGCGQALCLVLTWLWQITEQWSYRAVTVLSYVLFWNGDS